MEDGGGGHTLQPHSCTFSAYKKKHYRLTIACPHPKLCPTPNFRVFLLGLGVGTKVLYSPRPDYRRYKIPSFTSPGHTYSPVFFVFLGHSRPLQGGGARVPQPPPPWVQHWKVARGRFNYQVREVFQNVLKTGVGKFWSNEVHFQILQSQALLVFICMQLSVCKTSFYMQKKYSFVVGNNVFTFLF